VQQYSVSGAACEFREAIHSAMISRAACHHQFRCVRRIEERAHQPRQALVRGQVPQDQQAGRRVSKELSQPLDL
jgi:hypothetical protein